MINKILFFLFFLFSIKGIAQKDIFSVARNGTVEEVKEIMKSEPLAINELNESGFTPLIIACYRGNNTVARFLADSVNDIDIKTEMGTALMATVVKGNFELGQYLLEKNANPNLTDSNGITALMYAIQFKNIDFIKELLKYGADKTLIDKYGKTAFEYAVFSENQEIINLLK